MGGLGDGREREFGVTGSGGLGGEKAPAGASTAAAVGKNR